MAMLAVALALAVLDLSLGLAATDISLYLGVLALTLAFAVIGALKLRRDRVVEHLLCGVFEAAAAAPVDVVVAVITVLIFL